MTTQIKDKVSSCPICNASQAQQQRESLQPHDIQGLPWQKLGLAYLNMQGPYGYQPLS